MPPVRWLQMVERTTISQLFARSSRGSLAILRVDSEAAPLNRIFIHVLSQLTCTCGSLSGRPGRPRGSPVPYTLALLILPVYGTGDPRGRPGRPGYATAS